MRERPILFNGDMVRAILDGRKTQTRRVVKLQPFTTPLKDGECYTEDEFRRIVLSDISRFGTIGDRLWVRETWGLMAYHDTTDWCRDSIKGLSEADCRERYLVEHAANWNLPNESAFWRPSIHMPRWASRITLEITGVRVERLNDISEKDAKAEGVIPVEYEGMEHPDNPWMSAQAHRDAFRDLWQSIYGNWDANPWVWVYEFRKM